MQYDKWPTLRKEIKWHNMKWKTDTWHPNDILGHEHWMPDTDDTIMHYDMKIKWCNMMWQTNEIL